MKNFEITRQLINHEFPEFNITTIKKIGEGDDSIAFLFNHNYIFRFPKRKDVKQSLEKEIAVLSKIKTQLDLEIPNFDFISKEINFVGYKSINGTFLTKEIYNSLEKEFQIQIQKSLAVFLSQLHHISLSKLKGCGLKNINLKEEYSDDFEDTKKLIFPNISPANRDIITKLFTAYLSDDKNFEYKPALVHNDFSTDHILFEISTKKVNGIIDFSDMAIGDPDYDFMYLYGCFGEDFIKSMLKFYEHRNHKNLLEKLHFFSLANKLQILIRTIKENNQDEIKKNYKTLDKWICDYKEQ